MDQQKRRGPPITDNSAIAIMAVLDGYTATEIAAMMELSLGAVLCALTRARKRGIAIPTRKRGPKGAIGWRDARAT
jgi:hypothetical protein